MTGRTLRETRVSEGTPGPSRAVSAGRHRVRRTGVDGLLMAATVLSSSLALVVLAGWPPIGTPAGDTTRGLVLLAFWLVAPGGTVLSRLRLSRSTKVAVTPLLGITLLVFLGSAGSWTGYWIPRGSAATVAAVALVVTLLDMAAGRMPLPRPRRPEIRGSSVLLTLGLGASTALWVASLPVMRSAKPSVLGLLVAGPRAFPVAIGGMTAVLLLALAVRSVVLASGAALGLILVLRTTGPMLASVPTAAWTYKHVGVVEALQQHHHVAGGMDIYMNWPGMFAAGAYFSDQSGVPALALAHWFPPVVDVLLAVGTAALARALGARLEGCVAAAGLFTAFNWVGQDYFSPQAIGLCLAIGVVLLLVQSSTSRACRVLALVLFAGIVPTHQLTPFWLVALAGALMVLRQVRWWVAGAMVLLLGVYVLTRLQVAEAYGLFSGLDPIANAQGTVPTGTALGRDVGGYFAKASSLLVWGSTLAVLAARAVRLGWTRGWRSPAVTVPAAIAFSPFLLLAGQNYGGEANLRVTLYSTVGCCAVLGPALAGAMQRRIVLPAAATVWAAVLVATTAQSSFGQWWVNLIRPEDVAAAQWLVHQYPNSFVLPVIGDWPGRTSVAYERYVQPFAALEPSLDTLLPSQVSPSQRVDSPSIPLTPQLLADVAATHPAESTFVVFTGSMRDSDAYYATYTPGSFDGTLAALSASPRWRLSWHGGQAWVFQYLGTAP